jgi:hypothetical protein
VGFGGVSRLFLSLWRCSATQDGDDDPSDDEILNGDGTVEKLKGYEWVMVGCPPQ